MINTKKNKTIVFDFDGTIVDTQNFIIKIYNEVAGNGIFKLNKIEAVDIALYRKLKDQELFNKLKITPLKIPFIAVMMHKLIRKKIYEISICNGIIDILKQLKAEGYLLCILSTNNPHIIKSVLSRNNLDIFDHVFSCKKIFGKDKALKRIVNKLKIEKDNVIYIGDEIRDIIASHKAGVRSIAVCWGFTDKEILEKENPQCIAETVSEILECINKLAI